MPITLTLKRASEESGLSVRSLQYAIHDGRLKSLWVEGRRLIPYRALEDFLLHGASRETTARKPTAESKAAQRSPVRSGDEREA